jgi:hypothetical protein
MSEDQLRILIPSVLAFPLITPVPYFYFIDFDAYNFIPGLGKKGIKINVVECLYPVTNY